MKIGFTMTFQLFTLLCHLVACSKPQITADVEYDLPGFWTDATLIQHFNQGKCNEDMDEVTANAPKASTKIVEGKLILTYPNAHYRCDQSVQGFVRQKDNGYAVLVQPIEMNPVMVAKCDCGYTLTAILPNVTANEVRLFHRGDNHAGEATIREIAVEHQ